MTGSEPTLREAVERDPLTGRYRPIDWAARAKYIREWLRPELLAALDAIPALPPAAPDTEHEALR